MKAQVPINANANSEERLSYEDVVKRRRVSWMLVDMLVSESSYRQAAEIVSGTKNRFGDYTAKLEECIISGASGSANAPHPNNQNLFDTWRVEIAYQLNWSESVLSSLPDHEDTTVLRTAFTDANSVGASLLQAMESVKRTQEARGNASIC